MLQLMNFYVKDSFVIFCSFAMQKFTATEMISVWPLSKNFGLVSYQNLQNSVKSLTLPLKMRLDSPSNFLSNKSFLIWKQRILNSSGLNSKETDKKLTSQFPTKLKKELNEIMCKMLLKKNRNIVSRYLGLDDEKNQIRKIPEELLKHWKKLTSLLGDDWQNY